MIIEKSKRIPYMIDWKKHVRLGQFRLLIVFALDAFLLAGLSREKVHSSRSRLDLQSPRFHIGGVYEA